MELLNCLDSVVAELAIPAYFFLNGKDNNKKSREASILFFIYLRISFLPATSLNSYVVNRKICTFINRLQQVTLRVREEALLFTEKRAGK